MKTLIAVAALLLAGAAPFTSEAAVVVRNVGVTNASFEDPVLADGTFSIGSFPGWLANTNGAGAGVQNPPAGTLTPTDGENVGYLNSYRLNGDIVTGSLSQSLNEAVAVATTYTLSVDVGRRSDVIGLGSWLAELLAGSSIVATGTLTDAQVPLGGFSTLTMSYTGDVANAGQRLGVRFRSLFDPAQAVGGDSLRQVELDQVRITAATEEVAAVPEPATWGMFVAGFGMLGGALRSRRKAVSWLA